MRSAMLFIVLGLCLGTWAQDAPDANWPDGYRLVCTLEPTAEMAASEDGSIALRRLAGASRVLASPDGEKYPVVAHPERVEVAAQGLQKDGTYVLGFEWWDADAKGRRQSVGLAGATSSTWGHTLAPTLPLAYHSDKPTFARVLLPIGQEEVRAEGISVYFENHGGPDVVVSKVWLLERVDSPREKRVLIVTGDDYKGHLWRETGPELAEILREDPRFEVSITESPAILGSPLLTHYDVVLLHFKNYAERLPFDERVHHGLRNFVDSGRGLVVAHFGCGAFQEWDGMLKTIGRVWNPEFRAHDKYGPFTVHVADTAHPITRGIAAFQTEDELYTCLDGEEPIHVLCDAVSNVDGKTYPMGLIPENSKGRVFLCTLGHNVKSLQAEGARTLYRRAVAWAAGLEP